jgi:hypothetical protein
MVVQVLTLMPLRTTMNYQYRFGGNLTDVIKTLYKEGGARRFYRGIAPALIQGPLSRFGDTASNVGALALLESSESTKGLPIAVKTLLASATSATFRIVLTPVDTLKTTLQTTGQDGVKILAQKMRANGKMSVALFTPCSLPLGTTSNKQPCFVWLHVLLSICSMCYFSIYLLCY